MLSCRKKQKADSNNEEFLIKLYQDYYRLMFVTARKYVSDFSCCEEVVQNSIVNLIGTVGTLQNMQRSVLTAYIIATVRNTAINYLKKCELEKLWHTSFEKYEATYIGTADKSWENLLEQIDHKELIRILWDRLGETDRFLLKSKYIYGYSDAELAQKLSCNLGCVRMRLTRARKRARSIIYMWEKEQPNKIL